MEAFGSKELLWSNPTSVQSNSQLHGFLPVQLIYIDYLLVNAWEHETRLSYSLTNYFWGKRKEENVLYKQHGDSASWKVQLQLLFWSEGISSWLKELPHPLPHPHVTAMPNADSAERRQLTKPTGPDHPGTWDRELQQHAAIFSHSCHRRKQATNTVQSIPEAKPPVEIHGSRPRAGADAKAKAKSSLGLVNRSQR